MQPDDLRATMLERRRNLSPEAVRRASATVLDRIRGLPEFGRASMVAAYLGVRGEIDLSALLDEPSPEIALPVTVLDEELRFVVPDGPLVDGPFGIRQPGSGRQIGSTDLDMVILPMVVGDVRGNRIGHGTGYYDRAFGFRRGRAAPPVLVGVAHAFQILPSIDARPWDVPLDIIVTDVGILRPGLPMGED